MKSGPCCPCNAPMHCSLPSKAIAVSCHSCPSSLSDCKGVLTLCAAARPLLPARPRAVKLMAVLVALLTPEVLEGLLQLLKAALTDERLTRCADSLLNSCSGVELYMLLR